MGYTSPEKFKAITAPASATTVLIKQKVTTLSADAAAGATSISVQAGDGSAFEVGDYVWLDYATLAVAEKVQVTSVAANSLGVSKLQNAHSSSGTVDAKVRIRVLSLLLTDTSLAAGTITFKDSDGNALTGALGLGATAVAIVTNIAHYCPLGLFQTPASKGLSATVNAGGPAVGGVMTYVELFG